MRTKKGWVLKPDRPCTAIGEGDSKRTLRHREVLGGIQACIRDINKRSVIDSGTTRAGCIAGTAGSVGCTAGI